MLQNGIVRESKSEYASSVLFVEKSNGELRMGIDYCKLNRLTKVRRWQMPMIEDQSCLIAEQIGFV